MQGLLRAVSLTLALVAGAAGADTLVLRDGRTLEGALVSASDGTVHFLAAGRVHHVPVADVEALRFAPRAVTALNESPTRADAGRTRIVGKGSAQQIERR